MGSWTFDYRDEAMECLNRRDFQSAKRVFRSLVDYREIMKTVYGGMAQSVFLLCCERFKNDGAIMAFLLNINNEMHLVEYEDEMSL